MLIAALCPLAGFGGAQDVRELYLRFKADEASQFVTGEYRRTHPDDNNERLPIHEHRNGLQQPSARSADGR